MGQTLENGIYLPSEGERNCYDGLAANWRALDAHLGNTDIHVTYADKQAWNGHIADTTIHVTSADKQAWNGHVADTTIHVTSADKQAWDGHVADTTIHVTSADKQAWNGHVADSVKHVTAEDKNKWDAVTSKADDSAVVHNTGAETVAGIKTFSDETYIKSLNFTNEVASQSSSSSAIMPIITTITYSDGSPSVQARLNLKVTADGIKSLYPHENNAYSLGLSSRSFSDFFSYHGYFRGQQQGDEYSGNARTNLTLTANRDTLGTSGCLIDTFRENATQGTGGHIIGFGIKENSIRYEGCRFSWLWNNNSNGYVFSFRPNLQGTNPAVEHNLGSSTDKWDKINGVEPSALSLPGLDNGVDISGYMTNAGTTTPSEYTPLVNGWIVLKISADSPAFIRAYSDGGLDVSSYSERNEIGSTSGGSYTCFASLLVPCIKNDKLNIILMPGTMTIISAKFYPCLGNV